MTERRTVLVIAHAAVPRGAAGGTRHVDLFSRLHAFDVRLLAGRLNYLSRSEEHVSTPPWFRRIRAVGYSENGWRRGVNWITFALNACLHGLFTPRLAAVYGSSPHMFSPLAGWVVARIRRVPLVLEVRDLWPRILVDMGSCAPDSLLYRVLARLERFLYRAADGIVVVTPGIGEAIAATGVDPGKIVVVPNGAEPWSLTGMAEGGGRIRSEQGWSGLVACYTGAHGPANGLDLVLDAAAKCTAAGRDVTIVLIGDGVDKDRLRERARREGIDNVRFCDPVPKTELPAWLAGCDVGIHCLADVALFETGLSPNKVNDYMAAALPVLTNVRASLASDIVDRGAGVSVEPHGIAGGLAQLDDLGPAGRRKMGAAGRQWLETERSVDVTSRVLESFLVELCGPDRRR